MTEATENPELAESIATENGADQVRPTASRRG